MQRKLTYTKRVTPSAPQKMPKVTATVENFYTEQMFVLVSMNILILKTELVEF